LARGRKKKTSKPAESKPEESLAKTSSPLFYTGPKEAPKVEAPKLPPSLWDEPGIAEEVEARWDYPNEAVLRIEIAEWIGPQEGKFLDAGCGSARMALLLKGGENILEYIGIDSSKEMIRLAQDRIADIPDSMAEVGSVEDLPYDDGSIPSALCMQVLRHLSTYDHALAQLARVVTRRVFIVDALCAGSQDEFAEAKLGEIKFPNNRWSIEKLLDEIGRLFPGWKVERRVFQNLVVGLKITAP